ncbi:hypothetical protein OUZ56_022389 [Daphnia magna]|uniref:Uncharacterized protein n=1 Tax=Daphnia magna TaxID=35525 RepID=A0ABR0AW84_9CRUS|nr:hypothetical protein OUZ56_022389 [Daphnia magna]
MSTTEPGPNTKGSEQESITITHALQNVSDDTLPSSLIICLMVRGAEESLRFVWPPVGYDLLAKGENISAQHKQSKIAIEKEIERKKKQKKKK